MILPQDLCYYNRHRDGALKDYIVAYADYFVSRGQRPATCRRVESIEEVLQAADVVSLHPVLNPSTHHMIDAGRLKCMKKCNPG
ncbi:MAG: NAD(P)-dependent oxidoreductase [Syntrophales bacterium]|nr:NAD(P)-dependent oxidoreductase [Syntrophales bacterium]